MVLFGVPQPLADGGVRSRVRLQQELVRPGGDVVGRWWCKIIDGPRLEKQPFESNRFQSLIAEKDDSAFNLKPLGFF